MEHKKQFIKNLVINGVNFIVNVMLGLLMTPFLVHKLGISAFGVVQVAISMATYTSILSTSLNQANNRFVSMSLASDNFQATSKVLSTIFILYGVSFIAVFPILFYIACFPEKLFNIEEELVSSVSYMFFLVGISQILIMLTTAFMSPAYAKNRLDIIQSINILRNALKLIFVFLLILFVSRSLTSVGEAFLMAAVISTAVAFVYFRKFVSFYTFRFRDFDFLKAKEIFKLSGWTAISALGGLLFLQTDVVLINIFLGAETSGHYAVLLQWSMLLIATTTILSVVISPVILNKYSYKKFDELKSFLYRSIKFQGVYTAIPTMLVFVYADTILGLWVGDNYAHLAPYLQVMIFHFGISQATRQLYTVNTAYNKVKVQGLMTVFLGFLHLMLSMLLLSFTDLGIIVVVASNALFTLLLNTVFLPVYISRYLEESPRKIYLNLLPAVYTQLIVLFCGYFVKEVIDPTGWLMLVLSVGATAMLSIASVYLFLVNNEEKKQLLQAIKQKV